MTDDDKALDKIIRASMPLDFERKETLSDDKTLVKRLRWSASGKVNAEQARLERNAADRIEVLNGLFTNATYEAAEMMKEIERLREWFGRLIKVCEETSFDGVDWNHWVREEDDIEHFRAALGEGND